MKVTGKFGVYSIGYNEPCEYATLSHKGSTIPLTKQDVAAIFQQLHKILYEDQRYDR